MNSFYKLITWTVASCSFLLIFIQLYGYISVAASSHNPGSFNDFLLLTLYLFSLSLSLIISITSKNSFLAIPGIALILIGVYYCGSLFYENYIEEYGVIEFIITGIPMVLMIITSIGLIKQVFVIEGSNSIIFKRFLLLFGICVTGSLLYLIWTKSYGPIEYFIVGLPLILLVVKFKQTFSK